MKIIDDIIDLLADEKSSTQSALLKAQILAHRLGDQELGSWVENELRGYPEGAEVPPYRVLGLTLVGHVTNGVYHYSNQTLPTGHLKEPLKTNLTQARVRDSVSAIESWTDKDNIAKPIPAEALHILSEPLSETYYVQQAWGKFSVGAMAQILTQVRSRLLGFCLRLSDQFPADLSPPEMREKAEEVGSNDIFRNAVFGDNTTIVVGSGSIKNVKNKIIKNDVESLLRHLQEHGVSKTDSQDLLVAIEQDAASTEVATKTLGPKVRGWIASMIGKAGTAAWEISMGAAGNILGNAISAYYGFGT
jgi:hypothetical protein